MKVLYHIGSTIGNDTIVKRGTIDENNCSLILESGDRIAFDNLKRVDLFKLNGLGTMITLQNGLSTVFLTVPRVFFNIGTGFAIINILATKKLKIIIDKHFLSQEKYS